MRDVKLTACFKHLNDLGAFGRCGGNFHDQEHPSSFQDDPNRNLCN